MLNYVCFMGFDGQTASRVKNISSNYLKSLPRVPIA
jgi:hypothetical protein